MLRSILRMRIARAAIFAPGLVLALGTPLTQAQDSVIGYVKTVQAEANVVVAGKSMKAQLGMPVLTGNVLRTGPQGSMGVTFRDNTMMSFGPNTELVVDEYLYAPGTGELKLGATLTKGTLQYISGVIAKLRPESVSLKTPAGIIGVRGTRYVVLVEDTHP